MAESSPRSRQNSFGTDPCERFELNPFRIAISFQKESCIHCGRLWTDHERVSAEDVFEGNLQVFRKASDLLQRGSKSGEWLLDGEETKGHTSSGDDDLFQMMSPNSLEKVNAECQGSREIPGTTKVYSFIDFKECNVPNRAQSGDRLCEEDLRQALQDFHLTDPADPSAAGFAFGFRVAPCRSHASVFDSFHSQQQPVQQQHSGWQQQPQNQQHGGWQQQPQNQQHGGWQQQPQNQQHGGWQQQPENQQHGGWQQRPQNQQHGGWQQQPQNQQHGGWQQQPQNQQLAGWQQQQPNQQQSPNQQHDGRQQQPPNQQQHGGPQQPPSSNEQQVTNSQHHAVSKERNDEQTDKADGDDADDQEVEPVAPPKETESKKKLAEEKAAEAKLKERAEEESKEKEAKAKDEEREKEKIEDKAKEMLKNLPPIPEDDQANHRSWESQLSSKDVKSQMETSREMDALRNKQHAGAFYTEATLLAAPRPRSGFLRFEAPTAPPQHIASVSARASRLREEGNANHRSWEAQLSAEQLKQQMTESRERDSLRGTDSSGSTDQDASGATSWASSSSSTGSAAASGRRAKSGSSGRKNGDNGGDNGDNGDEDGGEGADGEDQGDTGVKVEMEAETEGGTAGAGASRVVLLPMIRQLGESIGLNSHWQNDIMGINLAMKNSRFPKFFCGRAGARPRPLADDDHPSIQFRYPVKNVSVELTDLGRDGKGEKEVIWSATYSTDKAITDLSGKMRPDGGDQTAYKPPCYAPKTKNRLELRVIADDPLDGTTAEVRAEAIHKKRTDRSIDEVADLEVQLIDRDDPMMLERFRKEAPAAHYFGGPGGAGMTGPGGAGMTAGARAAAAAAAAAAEGGDEFSFAGRAQGGGFDVDSGAFGSAEEAEAYGQMLMDLVKYKKMGPYVAMAPLPVALMDRTHWRSWKSTRQALSLFL